MPDRRQGPRQNRRANATRSTFGPQHVGSAARLARERGEQPQRGAIDQPRATPWVLVAEMNASPERAACFYFAPSGLVLFRATLTQGCALGYHSAPLQGEALALHVRTAAVESRGPDVPNRHHGIRTMRAAIIGLPQSGKTTLFAAVTGQQVDQGEAPQEHLGAVSVPDERVDFLAGLYKPKKTTYATMEFVDVPGFSLADRHGLDEFRRHLPTVRQSELLVGVIRDFTNDAVPPYRDRVDAPADLTELWEEFVFADLEAVGNRIERLEKALTKPTRSHETEKRELLLMEKCRDALENLRPLSEVLTSVEEKKTLSSFGFLTEKPFVVVYNVDEDHAATAHVEVPEHARAAIVLSAEAEVEIAQLDEADRPTFLEDLGVTEPAREHLVRACFQALGLITFLTVGDPEVHAWTIRQGATALEAAGCVHSDLARGFIRAETVAFEDLIAAGDMRSAKAAGKVRQESKTYIVQDGDLILIKFNV